MGGPGSRLPKALARLVVLRQVVGELVRPLVLRGRVRGGFAGDVVRLGVVGLGTALVRVRLAAVTLAAVVTSGHGDPLCCGPESVFRLKTNYLPSGRSPKPEETVGVNEVGGSADAPIWGTPMSSVQIILSLAMGVLAFLLARYVSDREARRARRQGGMSYTGRLLNRGVLALAAWARPRRSRGATARSQRESDEAFRQP